MRRLAFEVAVALLAAALVYAATEAVDGLALGVRLAGAGAVALAALVVAALTGSGDAGVGKVVVASGIRARRGIALDGAKVDPGDRDTVVASDWTTRGTAVIRNVEVGPRTPEA